MSSLVKVEISQIEDKIVPILKKHELIAGAYLFGSILGTCRPDSDIDIGIVLMSDQVEIEKNYDLIEAAILREQNAIGKHPFDLVFLNRKDAIFSYKVIKNGKLIFIRNMDALTDFIESVSIKYRAEYPRYRQALEIIAMGGSK